MATQISISILECEDDQHYDDEHDSDGADDQYHADADADDHSNTAKDHSET